MDDIKKHMHKFKKRRTLIMALTYIIFFLPRFTEYKDDPEMHYHMKQALGIFIASLALRGLFAFGYGVPYSIILVLKLVTLVYILLGIRNVLEGKMHPLPYIGTYAERVF